MAFFDYRQNNSGGGFDIDGDRGISVYVVIEADNAAAADSKAESIGLYFDGGYGRDCDCCGDRWYRQNSVYSSLTDRGDPVPSLYGQEVKPNSTLEDTGLYRSVSAIHGYIHYANGRKAPFGL